MAGGPGGVLVTGWPPGSGQGIASPGDVGRFWWTTDGTTWTTFDAPVVSALNLRATPRGFVAIVNGWTCPSGLMGFDDIGAGACVTAPEPVPGGPGTESWLRVAYLESIAASDTVLVATVYREFVREFWVADVK
jgi:hypothetical protein